MKFVSVLVVFTGLLTSQRVDAALWNETYAKGQVIRLPNDFDIYSVGESTRNLSIIVIYDIRGFNISQTRVFCDRLASEYSVHVVMPDFFRGTAAPTNGSITEWLAGVSNWSKVSNDLETVADWLHNLSSTDPIGIIGFCWGGLQVVRACSNLSTIFFTGISIHGSQITVNEVKQLQQPMLFIAAGNDPPLQPNISNAIEEANPEISKQCEYKTYANMRHGFVAAGANYSDPANVAAIDDVHLTVRNYLDKIMNNVSVSLPISSSLSLPISSSVSVPISSSVPLPINFSVSLSINFYFLLILFFFSFDLYI